MTSNRIARDYLEQARLRRMVLGPLQAAGGHAAVVRESQEIVEFILKGALRFIGVDSPKRHDVHAVLTQVIDRLPAGGERSLDYLPGRGHSRGVGPLRPLGSSSSEAI